MNHLNELRGQPAAKSILNGYLETYPPALLIFYGPPGVGKWSAAEAFIRQFLCAVGSGCGSCSSCRKLLRNEHADYIRFPAERVTIGDAQNPAPFTVRWLLKTRIPYSPFDGKTRFVLFPQGENIQHEAETALLKNFEEAPRHTRFILLVDELASLKATVVSRGICIPFHFLPEAAIREITACQDALTLSCLGGSLANAPLLESKFYVQLKKKIPEALKHPLEWTALEKWLVQLENPKIILRDLQLELDYKNVLEFFSLMLLILIRDLPAYRKLAQVIFQFKQDLRLNMAGLLGYLVSRLFAQFHSLHFSSSA